MPAIKKVPRENIISAAVAIIREGGMAALNARSLSKKLNCSTRPLYLSFAGMGEIKAAAIERITEIYQSFLSNEAVSGKYPVYKSFGMGYIKFAMAEKELFSYMFMRKRAAGAPDDVDIEPVIAAVMRATGLSYEDAKLFHFESWIFVHGLAAMAASGFAVYDEQTVSMLLTDMFEGLKARFKQRQTKE